MSSIRYSVKKDRNIILMYNELWKYNKDTKRAERQLDSDVAY